MTTLLLAALPLLASAAPAPRVAPRTSKPFNPIRSKNIHEDLIDPSVNLNKSTVWSDGLSPHFVFGDDTLPAATVVSLDNIDVPDACTYYASQSYAGVGNGGTFCTAGLEAKNLTLSDCTDSAWTMCRCTDAIDDWDIFVDHFSRVPVNMRDYTRYIMAFAGANSGLTYYGGDTIIFGNETLPASDPNGGLDVYLHEIGHAVDFGQAYTGDAAGIYSQGEAWSDAITGDSCVPDDYSNSDLAEDFAQQTVVQLYLDLNGQTAPDSTDISCMAGQTNAYQAVATINSAAMTGTTTCDMNVRNAIAAQAQPGS